jgi:hypothetical protein
MALKPPNGSNSPRVRTNVLNVQDYGATGGGTTDDSTAVQETIADAAELDGGQVYFPAGVYKVTALTLSTGVLLKGDSQSGSTLKVTTGDMFSLGSAYLDRVTFEDLTLVSESGAGHLFVGGSGTADQWAFRRCNLRQLNSAKSIWRHVSAGPLIEMVVEKCFMEHVDGATVPAWNLVTENGDINKNHWVRCRTLYSGEYFFHVEQTAAGQYVYDNVWRDINAEVCRGGFAKVLSGQGNVLENVSNYDMAVLGASTRDWIVLGKSASAPTGVNNTVINARRLNGSLGVGLVDLKLASVGRTKIVSPSSATLTGYAIDLGSTAPTLFEGVKAGITFSNSSDDTLYLDPYARGIPAWSKAGVPADADFPDVVPPVGTQVLDTTNSRIYYKTAESAGWKYAALT